MPAEPATVARDITKTSEYRNAEARHPLGCLMATFTLVVRPDGRALLTTPLPLSYELREALLAELRSWSDGEYPVAVVADCDVVQVADVEIDLPVAGASA